MSKKMFNLVVGIVGGVGAISSTVVTYIQPIFAAQIVAGIGIASTAITEICSLFVREEK